MIMKGGNDADRADDFVNLLVTPIAPVSIRAEVTTQAHYVISKSNCL